MNREIKFRAWDNKDYMSSSFTLVSLQEGKTQYTSDCKVMQYSGLNDIKGKEIYEGDILYVTGDNNGVGNFNPSRVLYHKRKLFVHWSDGVFYLKSQNHRGTKWILMGDIIYLNGLIVVGNIYENPELLNKKVNKKHKTHIA
jgi:uncharacterized phage protein (TIGR01671 family)